VLVHTVRGLDIGEGRDLHGTETLGICGGGKVSTVSQANPLNAGCIAAKFKSLRADSERRTK